MPTSPQPVRTRIANLDCLELRLPGDDPGALTALCLHGYGAGMSDLAPLAHEMPLPPGSRWIFPNAPLTVPIGPFWTGSAWFPIDIAALERAMATGSHRDLSGAAPPELGNAREALLALMAAAGGSPSRWVLAGFSQGAMMALEVALHLPIPPAALLLWSGTLLQADIWRAQLPKLAGIPVLQSHGRSDPLLAFEAAERLQALLSEAGCRCEFIGFEGGHEIPRRALERSAALLKGLGAMTGGER